MPVAPTSVAALLSGQEAFIQFRAVVRELFPGAWDAVMNARQPDDDRETARVLAFCGHLEANHFPIYEAFEYEQVAYDVPIVRFGWSLEQLHDLNVSTGYLLLLTLCGDPYVFDSGLRVSVLDAAEAHLPRELLAAIPGDGLMPSDLRARLEGTRYAAAADFAEWVFHDTGYVFLDSDDEDGLVVEWARDIVDELTEQWREARALLDRVAELARWLEADPAKHFALLLDAVIGGEPHEHYLRERQAYACEITEAGVAPVPRDEPVALPAGPAG